MGDLTCCFYKNYLFLYSEIVSTDMHLREKHDEIPNTDD